jgi:hypothetical protein
VRTILPIFFSLVSLASAEAQSVKYVDFTARSDKLVTTTETQRFCLPDSERLIRVVTEPVKFVDSSYKVSFGADTAANCIVFTSTLPPAEKICTRIPVPSFPSVVWKQKCDIVPNSFTLSIDYEFEPKSAQKDGRP